MTQYITLSKGYSCIVDDEDADMACFKWYSGAMRWGPYAQRDAKMVKGVKGKKILMHRMIAERMGLDLSLGVVDHMNGNSLDNRRSNLRVVSVAENARNTKSNRGSKSGVLGVHYDNARKAWKAYITVDGKLKNLGRFATIQEATAARLAAEREMWGIQPQRREAHGE